MCAPTRAAEALVQRAEGEDGLEEPLRPQPDRRERAVALGVAALEHLGTAEEVRGVGRRVQHTAPAKPASIT